MPTLTDQNNPMAPENLFGHMYNLVQSNDPALNGLRPIVPARGVWGTLRYHGYERWANQAMTHSLQKAMEFAYIRSQRAAHEAAVNETAINVAMQQYLDQTGIRIDVKDKTDVTFGTLREWGRTCEPAMACVSTRIEQVADHSERVIVTRSHADKAGFRIKMTNVKEQASKADEQRIAELEQYISECGYGPPPEDQIPEGWQPGFEHFLRSITRDALELDWVSVLKWKSDSNAQKFPIFCFAATDAGLIRRRRRELLDIHGNRLISREYPHERQNLGNKEAIYVKVTPDGTQVIDEYSSDEMFCSIMRPRTDERVNGYGYSMLEQAYNAINAWVCARDYNTLRFDKDSIPRGLLTLIGNYNAQQLSTFTTFWRQMCEGVAKRWAVPILTAKPEAGAAVNWTPLDMSNRDLEYSNFLFTIAIWIHATFHIHPDETGYSASSPFRPPLSEASPDTNLQYSQDKGLAPLLRYVANIINRDILWKIEPSRRYSFEFVGKGNYNELEDAQTRNQRLVAGLTTPRIQWAELDQRIPEPWADHPAWDFPAPFMQGVQLVSQMQQQQHSQEMAQQQQQAQLQQGATQSAAMAQDPQAIAAAQMARQDQGDDMRGGDQPSPMTPGSRFSKAFDDDAPDKVARILANKRRRAILKNTKIKIKRPE